MSQIKKYTPDWLTIQIILRWCGLCLGPAALSGLLTLFLVRLTDKEQTLLSQNSWLYLLLPIGATAMYLFQRRFPQKALPAALEELHENPHGVPRYAIPFIYCSTLLAHLFGGSIGREGASFQAASIIGYQFGKRYVLDGAPQRIIGASCIAASFCVLFGAPIAAAFFALELTRTERFPSKSLVPCIMGGLVGQAISSFAGPMATQYKYLFTISFPVTANGTFQADPRLFVVSIALGVLIGALSCGFAELSVQLRYLASWIIQPRWVATVFAALLLAVLGFFTPARAYMGLGIIPPAPGTTSILSAFQPGYIPVYAWLIKLGLTLLTLAAGYRGGEISPLLLISVLLAHAVYPLTGLSLPLICSLSFIAIIAAAANTPIAAILLSAELFGSQYLVYYALCVLIAYFLSPATKAAGKATMHAIPKLFTHRKLGTITNQIDE